jgi:RNA polymerase sigma factor (sigma-70 family)
VEREAFLDFYRELRGPVSRYLVAAVGPNHAEDCLQETFLAALRSWPSLPVTVDLKAWVAVIARHKAYDHYRAAARRPLAREEVPEEPLDEPAIDRTIWQSVRRLPHKQRAAIYHRFVEDLSYSEIGRRLRCSPGAARQSVHEGLKKLRSGQHRPAGPPARSSRTGGSSR